jgi:hypothetical protein
MRVLAAVTGTLLVSVGAADVLSTSSCTATATNNPLRSFENARDVDVVCMQVLAGEDGGGIPPLPLPQAACTPVPLGLAGTVLANHLYALVTQTKRGEVAVVDLTGGFVVDEDLGTPGMNFLPVGQMPSGIAAAPDGKMTYVAAAEVNKPAVYGLPSTLILGNSQQLDGGGHAMTPPLLTTWPVCALPALPGPITIIPNPPPEPTIEMGPGPATDGGTDAAQARDGGRDGGADATTVKDSGKDSAPAKTGSADSGGARADAADAGSGVLPNAAGYVLAVVLPGGSDGQPARVITIDPLPLLRGGGVLSPDSGPVDPPAQLAPCTILGQSTFSGGVADAGQGPAWPDGVEWIDAAIDATLPTAAACSNQGVDAGTLPPSLPGSAPMPTAVARAGQFLYVADGALPLIHVFDVSIPSNVHEIAPLRATSLAQPSRTVTISALAISPPTRDYKRFLYAVDATDSPPSIIVYDVTDPVRSPHVPLVRPHSALVPIQSQDRISFAAGVSAIAFVQHDWPLAQTPGGAQTSGAAATGLLCNPNPNVDLFAADASPDAQQYTDPGANYRYSSIPFADEPLGPMRLRGIFAFATLSNGQVVTIDVDDWDAPCRRPSVMGPVDAGINEQTSGYTNAITPPEPNIGMRDGGALDPWEAPFTGSTNGVTWVTNEVFFPVSAPHRPRSNFPLSNNAAQGIHYPYLVGAPELYSAGPDGGLGASVNGSVAAGNPAMLPTATVFPDPSDLPDGGVGIRIAWEDPTAHIDQNWTVDYEGKLVSFNNIVGDLAITGEGLSAERPPYYTLFVSDPGGEICSKGVEDWTVGQQRAATFLAASTAAGLGAPEDLDRWIGDYVQIADDLLQPTDPYWSSDPQADQTDDCWAGFNGTTPDGGTTAPLTDPTERYNTCLTIFDWAANQSVARDFPIVQAFDDGLVITRFNYPDSTTYPVTPTTSNRQTTPPDVTNIPALKQLKCCFHGQATFNVRAGGEWVTTGSASGFFHRMTVDPATNRCVTSCDPQKALLNARAIGIASGANYESTTTFIPDRDSPLAMRNPIFAFFMQHPWVPDPNISPLQVVDGGFPEVVQRPARDFVWQFGLKGQLSPLTVNLASTNSSVSPQSMLFIPSLGQIAVVDGSQAGQGLILIDLNSVSVSGNTYY